MQSIPLKKSAADIDLISPLGKWIDERGGNVGTRQKSKDADDHLATFARMRMHAVSVRAATNVGEKAVETYLAEVLALNASFASELESSCLPAIHWVDAWRGKHSASPNPPMLFEQACLEFNLYAMVASKAAMDAKDLLLKEAANGFQVAAGGFNRLRDEVVPRLTGTLTTDLTSTSLNFLSSLALANAQSLFYEKAVSDGLRHALLAKLAQEASCMYKSAAMWASRILELPPQWLVSSSCNGERLSAFAQWHTTKDVLEKAETETGEGYGEAIVRLRIAVRCLESTLQAANSQGLDVDFQRPIRALMATCKKDLTSVEKDNSTVYLEQLPQASSLPPIPQVCIAKPLPAPIPPCGDATLFQHLLPLEIATAVREFRKSTATELCNVQAIATEADTNCASSLKAMGLPASLETEQEGSEQGISDATWSRVESTQGPAGGFHRIVALTTTLAEYAKKSQDLIDEIDSTTKTEVKHDNEFRARYGDTGRKLTSSTEENSNILLRELSKSNDSYRELWKSAQGRDVELMASIHSKRDQFSILQLSREELSERMPDETGVTGGAVYQLRVDELSALLIRLAKEKEARQHSLSKLREKSDGTELRSLLLESPGGSETDSRVQIATKNIKELGKEIRVTVEAQKVLIEEVEAKNVALQEARKNDGLSALRADFCGTIVNTATDFHHIVACLNEGVAFYGDLIRRLAHLNQNLLDAAYTMNLSRREMELSYAAQRVAQQIPSGGAAAVPPQAQPYSSGAYPSLSSVSNKASDGEYLTTSSAPVPLPASSAPPLPPSEAPSTNNKVQKLVDMGFSQTEVEAALEACQGNENLALSHLLLYGVGSGL